MKTNSPKSTRTSNEPRQSSGARKILASLRTYRDDCTSTGYELHLRADGSVRAQHRSCWQGSRSGQVYVSRPGYIDLSSLGTDDESDAEAILTRHVNPILEDLCSPEQMRDFRQIRRGWLVR